jgi:hypothetical protein
MIFKFMMKCGHGILEVKAFTKSYFFDVSDPNREPVAFTPKSATQMDRSDLVSGNLGHWSRVSVLDLDSDGAKGDFQLVIAKADRRIYGGIEHFTFSELIHRTELGEIRQGLPLFSGIFLETIDLAIATRNP